MRELCRRLVGSDRAAISRLASQTLTIAHVNHGENNRRALNRASQHRRNSSMHVRSLSPTKGTSLIETLNRLLELEEEKTASSAEGNQMTLSPQTYIDRYTVGLLGESLRNTLSAVVGMAMTQHDYLQRDARVMFELLIQDRSSVKPDPKFYEKRSEIKEALKNRFLKTDWFQLDLAKKEKEILTEAVSESEAEEIHTLLGLCARLLGEPIFSAPFDPDQPIPELASNARNFEEENELEHRRIRAVVHPYSFANLINSLGYTTMKKKAKGPVLNTVRISANGNNGNHGTPLSEDSEADIQDDVTVIVDNYVGSAKFRRRLKQPQLEVVVDGIAKAAPFAAAFAASRRFQLSSLAKYVQIYATQDGRRDIVSSLSLPQTEISSGKTWFSELELEGKQVVRLTVEPQMDDSGKLAGSSLQVGYRPKRTIAEVIAGAWPESWGSSRNPWPSWVRNPIFAAIIGSLALLPFFTIKFFSLAAFSMLVVSLTALLLVAGRINPEWRPIRVQQVVIDGYVALMLMAMLLAGILPVGRGPEPAIGAVSTAASKTMGSLGVPPDGWSYGEVVTADPFSSTNQIWALYSLENRWKEFDINVWDTDYDPYTDYLLVRPWQGGLQTADRQARLLGAAWPGIFNSTLPDSVDYQRRPEAMRIGGLGDEYAAMAKNDLRSDKAHKVKAAVGEKATLPDTFYVEVLVNSAEIITLINHGPSVAPELATSVPTNQPAKSDVLGSAGNAAVADAGKAPVRKGQPTAVEVAKASDAAATSTEVSSARKTAAWVVFESPTQLGSLNKGDVVNANFKPMQVSKSDPRGGLLACTATGVVREKRTSGTDVEVRVGLTVTWVHNGDTVNGNLDLLLTDCALDKENSHRGFLAVPQNLVAEVARIERRPRKQ